MAEERVVDRLRRGEKIVCDVCHKDYYDVSSPNREFTNYFHCENPECKGCVHIQKAISIE